MKIKNTEANMALVYAGSIIGTVAVTYVIAKKANIDEFVVAMSPIIGLGVATAISAVLLEQDETISNATGSVRQVKGRFP